MQKFAISLTQPVSQFVCLSVPMFVHVSVALIGRIFVNFETGKIDLDLLRKSKLD